MNSHIKNKFWKATKTATKARSQSRFNSDDLEVPPEFSQKLGGIETQHLKAILETPALNEDVKSVTQIVNQFLEAEPVKKGKILHKLSQSNSTASQIVADVCKLKQSYDDVKNLEAVFSRGTDNLYDLLAAEEADNHIDTFTTPDMSEELESGVVPEVSVGTPSPAPRMDKTSTTTVEALQSLEQSKECRTY